MSRFDAVFSKWDRQGPSSSSGRFDNQPSAGAHSSSNTYNDVTQKGRKEWQAKFQQANLAPPNQRHARERRRQHFKDNQAPPLDFNQHLSNIASFKAVPSIKPLSAKYCRCFMGRCCMCMKQSRLDFYDENTESKGISDILRLNTAHFDKPWLSRTFCHLLYAWQRPYLGRYASVNKATLHSSHVNEAVQQSAMDIEGIASPEQPSQRSIQLQEKRARSLFHRMRATISTGLTNITAWFLHKLLGHLFSAVLIHKGQMEMISEAGRRKLPIIFLPSHRSHMDYILLTWITWNFDIRSPYVAAGENLMIPLFGNLMRCLGGFFIRRRIDHADGSKDVLYRSVLQGYMEELLRRDQHFEFFVEGTRSRNGRSRVPKGGLLSVVVDSYMQSIIRDALIVPVSISYERVIEGNFCDEQMGKEKRKENFWGAWQAIVNTLSSKLGMVRVDFAQPFSLKEYMEVSQSLLEVGSNDGLLHSEFERGVVSPAMQMSSSFSSTNSLFGMDDHRNTIQGLAEHVQYSFTQSQALMSTHLISFLMVTQHRNGCTFEELICSTEWLLEELKARQRDIGCCGQTDDILHHAIDLLGVNQSVVHECDMVKVGPHGLKNWLELNYYAGPVLSVFAMESLVAFAVVLEADNSLWTHMGLDAEIIVSRVAILQHARNFAHLFQYEFLFKTPCKSWEGALNFAIDQLLSNDILVEPIEACNQDVAWAKRYSRNTFSSWGDEYSDEDNDEDNFGPQDKEYQIQCSDYSLERLRLLISVFGPLLECYHVVMCNISHMAESLILEADLCKRMQDVLHERVENGIASYPESSASDTILNCVRSLAQMGILDASKSENSRFRMISIVANAHGKLETILEMLDLCRLSNMI